MVADFWKFVKKKWLVGASFLLLLSLSFALGIIVGGKFFKRPPMIIEKDLLINLDNIEIEAKKEGVGFVASSKGKYYYPIDCPLAKNLSEKNKIYFNTKEEAESRGYIYNARCNN